MNNSKQLKEANPLPGIPLRIEEYRSPVINLSTVYGSGTYNTYLNTYLRIFRPGL